MQKNRSKRYRAAAQQLDRGKSYNLTDAVSTLKKFPPTKFDQTVTVSFRLGVDPKQSDQMVRGTCPLPHGSGKHIRVLVFAEGDAANAAREAGAEFVGMKDLIQKCQEGFQDFDVGIATPAAMAEVRKLGKVLGPRGLMPNQNPETLPGTSELGLSYQQIRHQLPWRHWPHHPQRTQAPGYVYRCHAAEDRSHAPFGRIASDQPRA